MLAFLGARLLLATIAWSPRPEATARLWVRLLELALPRLRRIAMQNLAMALPSTSIEDRRRIVDGSFHSIARVLAALTRIPKLNRQNIHDWIRYEGFEHYQTAKARGKGVLFATAHLGNWELSAVAHSLMTEPMHVVVRPLDNPYVDRLIERLRTWTGNQVIGKKEFARGILKALSRNEAVGILIDQNVGARQGVFIPFFGIEACVDAGFAKIAAHSGAAIIPGWALWSEPENRYILKFHEPLWATGDVEADTRRVHAVLEQSIRDHPDQWLWMHRRWKTRPEGDPPLY